jgi:hypothetical protein
MSGTELADETGGRWIWLGLAFVMAATGVAFLAVEFLTPGLTRIVSVPLAALLGIGFLVLGLYDSGDGRPIRGLSNLVAASGMTLVFLSPYSRMPLAFVLGGVAVLVVDAGFQILWALDVNGVRERVRIV